ncbi:replication protein A 70 kDa DNA-binding subunit isoform X2 [Lingula anatina]|uniref:Replication protein A subunit n=1 Tax=Lingula anatina TaxID=7574 RepID=A0A1S3K9H4_LINAN|nr:replication protein A 70 kDa DNA-binding subunit isoform X2 [Lingula anatina]|eukprot:XP_013419280.1 replication protein A 70 kDa DNA-binding subunit isoform X2 [Lingula anatina]
MSVSMLTAGAIRDIVTGKTVEQPVLQVLGHKKIAGSGGSATERFRLLLSDGVNSQSSAMLGTQLNYLVLNGELEDNSIVRLDKFICNTIPPDRRVMILLELSIIKRGSEVPGKLGNPVPFKGTAAAGGDANRNPPQQTNEHAASNGAPEQAQQSTGQTNSFYGKNNVTPKAYGNNNLPQTPGGSTPKVYPITALTPYQNRWTIRARLTNKSNIRTWSNSRGEGKLFSMTFTDESGEIRATAFKAEVDKFYDILEVNKVYYVTKATLKTANKQYSSVDNDYEMTLNRDSQIEECTEDVDLPTVTFNFTPINALGNMAPNTTVDVIGVVKSVADVSTIIAKATQKELKKREVSLVDQNQVMINLTLWGETAEGFDGSNHPVLAIKGARLSDFGGRSLSTLSSSQLIVNPDIEEAHRLKGWYDRDGHNLDFQQYRNEGGQGGSGGATNWKSFAAVKQENIGATEKPDYYSAKGTVIFMRKENCMYQACPKMDCNKKVVDQSNGLYRCEKCQLEYPNYKWRMILSANLADYSDNQWVTCFQETTETLLGKSADELGSLRESDEASFDQIFQEATFKSYTFKLRAKQETYNDESRLKTIVVNATPIDYREYNRKLIQDIEKMAGMI